MYLTNIVYTYTHTHIFYWNWLRKLWRMRNSRTICWSPRKADVIIQSKWKIWEQMEASMLMASFGLSQKFWAPGSPVTEPRKWLHPSSKKDENLLLPLCSIQAFHGLGDGHTQRKCDLYPVYKFQYLFLLNLLSDNAGAMFYLQSGQLLAPPNWCTN